MFAVVLVPLIIAAGIGVDVARAMSSRNNLQDALDSTSLALAHLPPNTAQATLNTKANAWLTANLTDGNLGPITLTVTQTTGQLVLTATSTVTTTLTGLAGVTSIPIQAASTAKWGLTHVEIALVLDNTGSMSGTKLTTLISAANELVDTLAASTQSSDPTALKISVVPFSMTINIGSQYQGQTWLTGTMPTAYGTDVFSTSKDRFTAFTNLGKSWAGCVEARPQPYDVQDTPPTSGTPATLFVPFFAPDEPGNGAGSQVNGTTYPNDYINDGRQYPTYTERALETWSVKYNCKVFQGIGTNVSCKTTGSPTVRSGNSGSTGYQYGPNAGCSLTPLLRLTNNVATVKTKISQMQAVGDTNIPLGMMWGWHTLSPSAPFGDGTAYNTYGVKKIVVLLTDGDNTMTSVSNNNSSYYNGMGYIWQGRLGITSGNSSTRTSTMDARLTQVCSNLKAPTTNITIYTVRIDLSGTAPAALSGCASLPEYFYDVPDVA
ncbi:MAG: pilus assembly protein TadG-related protein, partial [Caulobacteraceae bacterium]